MSAPARSVRVLLAAAGLLLGLPARAEDPAAAPEAPATAPAPDVVRTTEPAEVSDVAPAAQPDDPSGFVTVIHTDDYRGENQTLEDLLGDSVGVQVRRFGGQGQPSEVTIRGSTAAQVVILLDGVRLNSPTFGAVDLSTIPLSVLDRVEISRGGGSVQVGSDAVGGVINLVSRRVGDQPEGAASGAGGSFGTGQWAVHDARSVDGTELTFAYDGFHTDGDYEFQRPEIRFGTSSIVPQPDPLTRVNNESNRQVGLLRVGRDLSDHFHVSASDYLSYQSRGAPGLDSGGGALGGQQAEAHERNTRNLAVLALEGADDERGVSGAMRLYHRYDRITFRDPLPQLGAPIDTENETQSGGGSLELAGRRGLWGSAHRLRLGLDGHEDWLAATDLPDVDRRSVGVFVQDDVGLLRDRVRVIPALRLDATEDFGREWLPRIGGVLEPIPGVRVKANLERSYRVPDFEELYFPDQGFLRGNPRLDPEKAVNWDAGFELSHPGVGWLRAPHCEAAYFHNAIDQSIVWVLVSPTTVQPENTGKASIRGVEMALGFGIGPWLRLSGNATWLDATLDDTGNPLPSRPDWEASGRAEIGPASGAFKLVGEVHYTDDLPVTFSGGTFISARTTYDASLSVDLVQLAEGRLPEPLARLLGPVKRLLVFVEGQNLSDESVRDAIFFPQPGRSLMFGGEVGW